MADPTIPPDSIKELVEAIWTTLKTSPGAIIAAIAALGAAVVGYLSARTSSEANENVAKTHKEVSAGDHALRLLATQEAQFEALVHGYKTRVDDLTHEVGYLRHRIDDLIRAIEFRLDACLGCEHAPSFLKVLLNESKPEPPTAAPEHDNQ